MVKTNKILIVEDSATQAESLKYLLENEGYKAVVASNGEEAIHMLEKEFPNLIISDIIMQPINGYELCKKIKEIDKFKDIPIILLTSLNKPLDIVQGIQSNADYYLTKPYDETYLLNKISNLLSISLLQNKKFVVDPATENYLLNVDNRQVVKLLLSTYENSIFQNRQLIKVEGKLQQLNDNLEKLVKKRTKKLMTEITERKKIQAALEESEKQIKHLYNVLKAIRNINQLIVKEKDINILLQKACDILTEIPDYKSAWLGFLKDEKSFAIVTGSPFREVYPFFAQLLSEDLPPCIKKAFIKKDLFLFMDKSRECGDCFLKPLHLGNNSVIMRIVHQSKLFGFICLSLKSNTTINQEERSLLEEVTGDIAFGIHNMEVERNLERRTYDLNERVKELNCLYEISDLVEKPDISLEAIIERTVNLIPSALQYPEIACAKIIFDKKGYKTGNFKETVWKQSRDIIIPEKSSGSIEIYYLEEMPEMDIGPFLKEEVSLIKIIAERLGKIIEREQGKIELQQSFQELERAMNATIETMSKIVEAKDPYTAGHQQRVSRLSTAIAKELHLSQDKVEGIRIASLIHDIGKIGLPTEILSKPNKLSDIEFSLIKEHPQIGYNILKSIDFSYPIANIVFQHHERLDGSGYPHHLKGDQIFLESRIIGVADVVEAMSSHRPYRPALGIDKALEEISQNKGILYDPKVVDICFKLFKEKGFKFE